MKVELDDDATKASEKAAGQLGMSVAAYINWLAVSVAEVNLTESGTITLNPQPPLENVKPRFVRYRKNWVVKF